MATQNVRHFNRYYARILGLFDKTVFDLNYSLAEMRILGEIARHEGITANELAQYLIIDKGYLSRLLAKLSKANLITRQQSVTDKRSYHLQLTTAGQTLNKHVEAESDKKIESLLKNSNLAEQQQLEQAMRTIEKILEKNVPNTLEEM